MLRDRDYLIFFLLLIGVVLVRVLPLPQTLSMILFGMIVIGQVIFVYTGLKRGR